ncbi:MAG: AAA family ATPase [Chloroflexi bacterium]|nr:AAA family ATPase [Chloroflexota bacterium]OJV98354.1 MAG: adenylate kinase [Chloroflexi bacterium 54-19]
MDALKGRRIVVVGTSGSGKTTLARRLAARLRVPHVETDALHWGPNWTEPPVEVFRERIVAALAGDAWVIDGNYSRIRAYVWSRAETLVWLDYPLPVIMGRLLRRTTRRIVFREELWSGNRESIKKSFFSKKSILWWVLTSYKRRRREYTEMLARPEYAHLQVLHFKSPRAADFWLSSIGKNA